MSDSAALERRYRQLLACYPRAFRDEHEQEMLAVLMAGADESQQRPRAGETADLLRNAIWIRLRTSRTRSRPTVFWAVTLMYICAAMKLLGVPLIPATPGSGAYPLDLGISWGVFALLAWANGRGYHWARVLFAAWVAFHTLALFYDITRASTSSPHAWTIIASIVFWLVELSAVTLILNKRSSAYYRHTTSPS